MLIQTRDQFEAARTTLLQAEVVAVDTETSGLFVHEGDRLCGISTYCALPTDPSYCVGFYFPFRHALGQDLFTQAENLPGEWLRELKPALERDDATYVYHNAKFDAGMLREENIFVPIHDGDVQDIMIMSHMVNENTEHGLKELGALYFGDHVREEERRMKKLSSKYGGYHKVPSNLMEPYAVKDAELTYDLFPILNEELTGQEMTWARELKFLRCLFWMESVGVRVDLEFAKALSVEANEKMRKIEDELGFDPLKLDVLAHRLFAAPPEGLGLLPGSLTNTPTAEFPRGRPTLDENFLSQHKDNPVISSVLRYRGLVKANSTWYDGFLRKADEHGRIHPNFKQHGTRTTRLSCSNPNLQQLPRNIAESPAKKLLHARDDHYLYEFDYSQIELRLASCYANDQIFLDAFKEGRDVHQETADAIGVSRQTAKHAAYTTLYGGAGPTLARTLERLEWQTTGRVIQVPDADGAAIIEAYYELHPSMRTVAKQAERVARNSGFVRMWNGRRRHFSGPIQPRWFHEHRKAFNSIIQGGSAQIMEDTMLKFFDLEMGHKKPYYMVIQVHDSLIFEITKHFLEDYIQEIKEIMEWPTNSFNCPFPVDVKMLRAPTFQVEEEAA